MIKYDRQGKRKTVNKKTTTKYNAGMPERYLEHMKGGGSVPQFCRNEDIGRATLDEWCLKYPEMAEAKKKGKILAEGWWIQKAQEHLVTTTITEKEGYSSRTEAIKFDTSLYKFMMAGRFGHTSDKALQDRIAKLEEQMQREREARGNQGSAYAEIAECEEDEA